MKFIVPAIFVGLAYILSNAFNLPDFAFYLYACLIYKVFEEIFEGDDSQ